jgi:hypothetical protein
MKKTHYELLTPEEKRSKKAYLLRKWHITKLHVAFHEAAHCAVAQYYGVCATAFIDRNSRSGNAWTGAQEFSDVYPPPFQSAVIGWAGSIGGFLSGWPLEEWPVASRKAFEAVEVSDLLHLERHWVEMARRMGEIEKAGGPPANYAGFGDMLSITGSRQRWRALRTSWNIVVSRRAEIARIAEVLIEDGRVVVKPPNNEDGSRRCTRWHRRMMTTGR